MALAALKAALEAERQALIQGDWAALERSTREKERWSAALAGQKPGAVERRALCEVRSAALHNARLAGGLGRQLGKLVGRHVQGAVYSRNARIAPGPSLTMFRRTG